MFSSIVSKLTSSATCSHVSKMFASRQRLQGINTDAEKAASWHDAPTVSTTFVQKNGAPFLGIYWGDNDAMNTFKQHPTPGANIFHASLESVLIALRQAVFERHLSKVIVRTNSEYIVKCANIYLKNWRENGYFKRDGSPVKNKEELQDLDQLLGMIEAKIELTPASGANYVLEKLTKDPKVQEDVKEALSHSDSFSTQIAAKHPHIVFVRGFLQETSKNAGYGIRFSGKPFLDTAGRFGNFPVTLMRAQLFGIIKALQQAKDEGLTPIHVVSDNPLFVKYYKRGWKKSDGTSVASEYYYKQIYQLAKEVDASFSYLTTEDNEDVKTAAMLAQDGISFPIISEKGFQNYGNSYNRGAYMEEFQKEHDDHLEKTAEEWKDVRRIYAVTNYRGNKRFCALYAQSPDDPETAFSAINGNIMIGVTRMLIPLLRKEVEKGATRLTVRTTEKRMPLVLERYIAKWETKGYTTSKGTAVQGADVYKEFAQLQKQIDLRIETFTEPENEEDKLALEYCMSNSED